MQIGDIVAMVATQVKIDQPTAESAIGTILSVLNHESEGSQVKELFDKIPGAQDLAQRYDVMTATPGEQSGGLLNMLGAALGERANVAAHGVTRLMNSGLTIEQVREAGTLLVDRAKAAAGPQLVEEVLGSLGGGLKGQLGL